MKRYMHPGRKTTEKSTCGSMRWSHWNISAHAKIAAPARPSSARSCMYLALDELPSFKPRVKQKCILSAGIRFPLMSIFSSVPVIHCGSQSNLVHDEWAVALVLRWAEPFRRVVGCGRRLSLHREEIVCVIPDALPTFNYNFDTHRSMEESRVNWREQWRWRSDALCGAKALHILEHLRHPLMICPALRLPLRHHPRLHLVTVPPLFF
jgi:hypothetical protein